MTDSPDTSAGSSVRPPQTDDGEPHISNNSPLDPYVHGAPLEVRLTHLAEFIASDRLTGAQKEEIFEAMDKALMWELIKIDGVLRNPNKRKFKDASEHREFLGHLLPDAIRANFSKTPEPFDAFLSAVKSNLPKNSPLQEYISPYKAEPRILIRNDFAEMVPVNGNQRYAQAASLPPEVKGSKTSVAVLQLASGLLKAVERHTKAVAVALSDPSPEGEAAAKKLHSSGDKHYQTAVDKFKHRRPMTTGEKLGVAATSVVAASALIAPCAIRSGDSKTSEPIIPENLHVSVETPPQYDPPLDNPDARQPAFVNRFADSVKAKETEPAIKKPTPPPQPGFSKVDGKNIYAIYISPEDMQEVSSHFSDPGVAIAYLIANHNNLHPDDLDSYKPFVEQDFEYNNLLVRGILVDAVAIVFRDINRDRPSILDAFNNIGFICAQKDNKDSLNVFQSVANLIETYKTAGGDQMGLPTLESQGYTKLVYDTFTPRTVINDIGYSGIDDPAERVKYMSSAAREHGKHLLEIAAVGDDVLTSIENSTGISKDGQLVNTQESVRKQLETIVRQSPLPSSSTRNAEISGGVSSSR